MLLRSGKLLRSAVNVYLYLEEILGSYRCCATFVVGMVQKSRQANCPTSHCYSASTQSFCAGQVSHSVSCTVSSLENSHCAHISRTLVAVEFRPGRPCGVAALVVLIVVAHRKCANPESKLIGIRIGRGGVSYLFIIILIICCCCINSKLQTPIAYRFRTWTLKQMLGRVQAQPTHRKLKSMGAFNLWYSPGRHAT